MANFHLGRRLTDRGRYQEALPHLEKAVATVTEGTALHASVLGLVHREMGDIARSKRYGRLALQHARERGAADLEDQIRSQLSP